jgi:hypothetical protein
MKQYDYTVLYVDFRHLLEREVVLAKAIMDQYYRSVRSTWTFASRKAELTA